MARSGYLILIVSFVLSSISSYAAEKSNPSRFNASTIQQLTGQTVQKNRSEDTITLVVPRDDLSIQMSGMELTSNRGLSSNVVFKKTDTQTSVSGDLVLLQDQVNPVLSVALTNGLEVTGLNNPFLWDTPRVMVMHIKGEGDVLQLAQAIGKVFKTIKKTANGDGDFPLGDNSFPETTLNSHKLSTLLGIKGQFANDVYQVQFSDGVKKTDTEMNKTIAVNTWAAFAGSDKEAVMTGTIATRQSELQKVLKALSDAHIYILAIYHYAIDDDQELVSIRFWGVGTTQLLAKSLRTTFAMTQVADEPSMQIGNSLTDGASKDAMNAIRIIPISSSSVQNSYCSYASALRASAEPSDINAPKAMVPQPIQTPVKEVATLNELKHLVNQLGRPSANLILSRWYFVKNNKPEIVSALHHPEKVKTVTVRELPLLIKLSHAKKENESHFSSLLAQLYHAKIGWVKNTKMEAFATLGLQMKPWLNPVISPSITDVSVISASHMLTRLSVIRKHFADWSRVFASSSSHLAHPVHALSFISKPSPEITKVKVNVATVKGPQIKSQNINVVYSQPLNISVISAKHMLFKLAVIKYHIMGWNHLFYSVHTLSFSSKAPVPTAQVQPTNDTHPVVAAVSAALSTNAKPHALITLTHGVAALSAKQMLSRLSVVKNNKLTQDYFSYSFNQRHSVTQSALLKTNAVSRRVQRELYVSARGILSKLSVVRDHPMMVVLSSKRSRG